MVRRALQELEAPELDEACLDTIYACQDRKDDEKAGVKSITLVLHRYIRVTLLVFASGLASAWLACGILSGAGIPYFVITVAGGALLLLRGSLWTDLDDPRSCLATVCSFVDPVPLPDPIHSQVREQRFSYRSCRFP